MPHPSERSNASTPDVSARLKSREPWLPVGDGNCTEAAPLVIFDTDNHGALEYFIAHLLLEEEGLAFRFSRQSLLPRDGRHIDTLIFDVKPQGATDWRGQRAFHFDITAKFDAAPSRSARTARPIHPWRVFGD